MAFGFSALWSVGLRLFRIIGEFDAAGFIKALVLISHQLINFGRRHSGSDVVHVFQWPEPILEKGHALSDPLLSRVNCFLCLSLCVQMHL